MREVGAGLLGRADAWRRAAAVLDRAASGVGGVVLVAGEAGIGKTAFCDALLVAAKQRGWTVSWAAAAPTATVPGLWPWRQLLATLDGGDLAGDESGGDAGAARVAQFDSIVRRIADVAAGGPVLAVLDDAHWADAATLAMLVHFAAASRSLPACVVATYRPEDASTDTPLGDVLPSLRRLSTEIGLTPLRPSDIVLLAADVAGDERLDQAFLDVLVEATNGNPLFVSEVVRQFAGGLPPASLDQLAGATPPAVASIVAERVDRLSEPCQRVLSAAAVLGNEINVAILASVLETSTLTVLTDLTEAVDAAVLRERGAGQLEFGHPLFQSAIYDRLGTAGRAAMHARVATALEAARAEGAPVELAALAHHFGRSAPIGNAAKAAHYAMLAGDEAMGSLAYETASRRYAQALAMIDLDPSAGDRLIALLARADADAAAGRHVDAARGYEAAADLAVAGGRATELARAALGRSGGAGMDVPTDDPARTILERALAVIGDDQAALRARLLARLSVVLAPITPLAPRQRLVEEAARLAAVAHDAPVTADVAVARCHVQAGPSGIASRLADAATIVRAATATRQLRLELLGRRLRVEALFEAGRFAEAQHEVATFEARARLVRDPAYDHFVPLWRGALAMAAGDDDGYRRQRDSLEAVLAHLPPHCDGALLAGVQAFFERIDRAADAGGAQAVFDTLTGSMDVAVPPQVAITRALVHALAGRGDEARAEIDRWSSSIRSMPEDAEWLPAVVQLGDIASLVGDLSLAPWARERLEPYASVWSIEGIGAAIRFPAARALAHLSAVAGDQSAADRWHALADEVIAGAGLPGTVPTGAREAEARLVHEGDVWVVEFGTEVSRVRDSKGMRDLAVLLSRPHTAVAALDLMADGAPTLDQDSAGGALDVTARRQYRRRLAELETELDDADRAGDIVRSERLSVERDLLLSELAGAYGLGGRARSTGSSAERARTAVTTRVKDALRRLDSVHPAAAGHLRRAVKTGTFCTYDPESPITWQVVRPDS